MDFGVAKMLGARNTHTNTLTGMRLGSPHFLYVAGANRSGELATRSDIYSLGAGFYEMFAGQKLFVMNDNNNLSSLFYAIPHSDPLQTQERLTLS